MRVVLVGERRTFGAGGECNRRGCTGGRLGVECDLQLRLTKGRLDVTSAGLKGGPRRMSRY